MHLVKGWYTDDADDAGAGGKSQHILSHLRELQARAPPRGYFLEPTKSILVVAPMNVVRV